MYNYDKKLARAVLKGMLTFFPGAYSAFRFATTSSHSGSSARFCYSCWLRLLVHLDNLGLLKNYNTIAEFGTGGSLGVGLCALLSGTNQYTAIDVEDKYDLKSSLTQFEELISLFSKKTPIPGPEEYPQINLHINNYAFPDHIFSNQRLQEFLDNERLIKIRNAIYNSLTKNIDPTLTIRLHFLGKADSALHKSFDMVFSRAVMEHVNDPHSLYDTMNYFLSDNGIMIHDIELHSHDITREWDGHHRISPFVWAIIQGRRPYFLNRLILEQHKNYILKAMFSIIDVHSIFRDTSKHNYSRHGSTGRTEYGATVIAVKHGNTKNE